MSTLAHNGWLVQLLRVLPAPAHAALDAWSSRLARQRLEQRRSSAQPKAPDAPIDYKLKHWRD
ncbi:MAG: hypothetical protein ACAH21_09360 [Ramlibacter sp.]|nr:hypothetical protein [Ramlibacter sp.]